MSSSPFASSLAAPAPAAAPRLEFRNITKRFGSIQALSDVSFSGYAGSVHAITGENGAGKSTLMKLLAGVFSPNSGEIRLEGQATAFEAASEARDAGISTVFQELTLLPNLTIAENLFLGREPRRFGMIDRATMRRRTREALDRIGVDFDAEASCGELIIAEQHLIEIAKGAAADSRIIIYDEPTAALDARGVDKLVALIESQKKAGKLIFYISHRLDEIFRLCDTTTVLKDGRHVTTCPTAELTRDRLVSLMVGRELSQFFPQRSATPKGAKAALGVTGYVAGAARSAISFELKRHEIVGLTGLEGQGQRELIRALAGLVPAVAGTATKYDREGGAQTLHPSVVAAARAGIGFVPEDRKSEGLYLPLSIEQNIGIGMLRGASMISRARIDRNRVKSLMRAMQVRARDEKQTVSSLSGGNQQKVMIGRWLASGIDVLLIEEPTRGVDVGAKSEIYKLLRDFADNGGAVLMTSSELTEHIGLCDRILVMRDHEIVAEMTATEASEEAIMRHALMGRAPRAGDVVSGRKKMLFGRSGLGLVSLGLPFLMFAVLSLSAPDFLSRQNIANINSQITALVIVALGQLIVALIGGIDISVGSVVSLSSVLIVSLDPSLAVPVALIAGVVVGLANGFGVAVFGVHPLIMTLSTMTFVQGFSLLFLSGAGGVVPGPIIDLAKSSVGVLPAGFFWCLAVIAVVAALLYRTPFGLRIFAIGANAHSAELSGVRVTAPRVVCYVLCSLTGAIAGVYLTGRIATGDPTMGQPFGIDSVTAIALGGVQLSGGVGSVIGAVLGTITLGLVANGMNMVGVSPFFRAALTGVLLLGAVSLQKRKAIGI